MEKFQSRTWGPFGWIFKDLLGIVTARFTWNWSFDCAGSYNGHGKFLMNVGPAIKEIYAAWGFTVNVNTTVSTKPTNYGTVEDPIAGIQVEVTMDMKTAIQHYVNKCRLLVKGDCSTTLVACDGY